MPSFDLTIQDAEDIKPGIHKLEIVSAVDKPSKAGNDMISLTLASESGAQIKDWIMFPKPEDQNKKVVKLWKDKFLSFLAAIGKSPKSKEKASLTEEDCIQAPPVWVLIEPDYKDKSQLRIKEYMTEKQAKEARESASADEGDEIPF